MIFNKNNAAMRDHNGNFGFPHQSVYTGGWHGAVAVARLALSDTSLGNTNGHIALSNQHFKSEKIGLLGLQAEH